MKDKALKWLKEWEGLINKVDFAAARQRYAQFPRVVVLAMERWKRFDCAK